MPPSRTKLPPVPAWSSPALQGLAYWLGSQSSFGLDANISEGAITWTLGTLLFAHRDMGLHLESEVMYRHIPEYRTNAAVRRSRARADIVLATTRRTARTEPFGLGEVQAVIEVKHNRSLMGLVWEDVNYLGARRSDSKAIRTFVIYASVNQRPLLFTDELGAAMNPRNARTEAGTLYRVRQVRRATHKIPRRNKDAVGHYAILIEVIPN